MEHLLHVEDSYTYDGLCRKCYMFQANNNTVKLIKDPDHCLNGFSFSWIVGICRASDFESEDLDQVVLEIGTVLLVKRFNNLGSNTLQIEEFAEIPITSTGTLVEIAMSVIHYYYHRIPHLPNFERFHKVVVKGIYKITEKYYGCDVKAFDKDGLII